VRADRTLSFSLTVAGLFQVMVGVAALAWALPLFADPPFLGNGLTREYEALRKLLSGNPSAAGTLAALRWKREWLFWRKEEGVLASMAPGGILLACGLASLWVGARSLAASGRRGK